MLILSAKRPEESLTYTIDWADRLAGDTIAGVPTVTVTGAVKSNQSNTATAVSFTLSGGTEGTVARIDAQATTAGGQVIADVALLEIGGEVVSLADAKAFLRVEHDDEDVLIASLVAAAVGLVERNTGKNLTPKIVRQTLAGFPAGGSGAIALWRGPATSVVELAHDDSDGNEQLVADFRLIEGGNGRLLPAHGESWPATASGPGTVRLTYVAGYEPADRERLQLAQAVRMLVAHWYGNREAVGAGSLAEVPFAVDAILAPFRPIGLG